MAEITMLDLPVATSVVSTAQVWIVQGGISYRTDVENVGGGGGGLVVGTTEITGGVTGNILFNNVGILGEKTPTGTGDVVLATSPTLVTPILGVASGTSLQLGTVSTTTGQLFLANSASAFLTTIRAGNAAAARTYTWPTNFGSAGAMLTDAAGNGTLSWVVSATSITVGTTVISGGATTRILYDNAGVLGEYTISGSGTVVVMATSPVLVTPTLGVAVGTSLQLGAVSTTTGQLFLANSASANLTTIQAGNAAAARTYTWPTNFGAAGTALIDAAGNGTLSWAAVGGLTIGTTAITSGTTTRILYNLGNVVQEAAGVTVDATSNGLVLTATATGAASLLTLTGQTGVLAASQPVINVTQTWNAAGVTFTGLKINITSTASAAASMLQDWQVGGSTVMYLRKDGAFFGLYFSGSLGGVLGSATFDNAGNMSMGGVVTINRNSGTGRLTFATNASDINFSPNSAITRLGDADAASPVAQTFRGQGSRSGTDSNVAGASVTIHPGTGTGTGTPSTLILKSPIAVASGTGAQTQTTGLTINVGTAKLTSYTVATLPAAATAGAGATAFVTDALTTLTLGVGTNVAAGGANIVPVYSDGTNWNYG